MKKILRVILGLIVLTSLSANAEAYYTNDFGLPFTEYQYNVMVERLSEQSVRKMPYSFYETMGVSEITEENYEQVIYDESENTNTRDSFYETTCKRIALSKTCNSTSCKVVFTNEWKCIPSTHSYDVSGVRLSSTTFYDASQSAFYISNGNEKQPEGSRGASNGIGYAYKVPSSGNIGASAVSVRVPVNNAGTVYGSYQHGVRSMSLTYALDFTFNSAGLGGVFAWSNDDYFDQMGGIYINTP